MEQYISKVTVRNNAVIREHCSKLSSRALWPFPIEKEKGEEQNLLYLRMADERQRLLQLEKNCSDISENLFNHSPMYPLVVYNKLSLPLESILQAREKIQKDVDSPRFFQDTLEQFGIPKKLQDSLFLKTSKDISSEDEGYISDIIAKSAVLDIIKEEYTLEDRQLFLDGLNGHSDESEPLDIQPSRHYLPNIIQMRNNIRQSLAFFEQLRQQKDIEEIVPGLLYSKIQKNGPGEKTANTKVQIDYSIRQADDKVVAEGTEKWFDLSETIPGFAHGIQGMRIGEKRSIYIHPSLSYGLDTLLEKGIYLTADVTLIKVADSDKNLPPLENKDVSYILNDQWFTEEKRRYQQTLRQYGKALRNTLEKTTLTEKVIEKFKQYILLDEEPINLTDTEIKDLNSFFWDTYQKHS